MAKAVELSAVAARDIECAVDHYALEAGVNIAQRFIADLDEAFEHLGDHPLSGSTVWAHELGIPELRSWALQRFPYIVFYADRPSSVSVWRPLHAKRDVPGTLAPFGGSSGFSVE